MEPFVSIVTPVYNGERFLQACVESVLAQEYQNWEYIIVNNCSTDRTLTIANAYAAQDRRVRIRCNTEFVNADANHNIAFREISEHSKYCKVIAADDWLEPQCIRRLVETAEAYPTAGLIGSYQRSGQSIRWMGLPAVETFAKGREIAQRSLRREINVLGMPTSVLYRADLVRKRESFFPHTRPHADTSACFEIFKEADFAFVHEVLSHERLHDGQVSSVVDELGAGEPAYIEVLQEYGAAFLRPEELAVLTAQSMREYYLWLGGCVLKLRGRAFWSFHARRMRELGLELDRPRILAAAIRRFIVELQHPAAAMTKIKLALDRLRQRERTLTRGF